MGEQSSEDGGEDKNYTLASTATPAKKPPPESFESSRLRTLVITSFWLVVIFLGLPVWLWTTSIHRARLPLKEMLDWADGKVYSLLSISSSNDKKKNNLGLGLQTYFPTTNRRRSTINERSRSLTPCPIDSTCFG